MEFCEITFLTTLVNMARKLCNDISNFDGIVHFKRTLVDLEPGAAFTKISTTCTALQILALIHVQLIQFL